MDAGYISSKENQYNFNHLKLLDHIVTPVWLFDINKYRIIWANQSALALWEVASEQELYEHDFRQDVSLATETLLEQIQQEIEQQQILSQWWTLPPMSSGKQVYIHFSGLAVNKRQTLMLCEGILDRNMIEREASLTVGKCLASLYDEQGQLLSNNPNFTDFYGNRIKNISDLLELNMDELNLLFGNNSSLTMERSVIAKSGVYWFAIIIKKLTQSHRIIVTQEDISLRKHQEDKRKDLAYFDHLTGLHNRYGLHQQLHKLCHEVEEFFVFYIDLDDFKLINDNQGHEIGDSLLFALAQRLKNKFGKNCEIARAASDEFVIVSTEPEKIGSIEQISQEILDTISFPFAELGGLQISGSLGASSFPGDSSDPAGLITYATTAMVKAKARGHGHHCRFSKPMSWQVERKQQLQNELKEAVDNNEFSVLYQPIVQIDTDKLIGMEALLTWENPNLGRVYPDEFVPEAERCGMMPTIGNWVLETACRQCALWQRQLNQPLTLSVNISVTQLTTHFIRTVNDVIKETGLDPNYLALEFTERVFVKNVKKIRNLLKFLSHRGISLSLDDFGSDSSSLRDLHEMPVQWLKLDRRLVKHCDDNHAVLQASYALASALDLKVVIEGIENRLQLEKLSINPCHYGQGFLFSKPLTPTEFQQLAMFRQLGKRSDRESPFY